MAEATLALLAAAVAHADVPPANACGERRDHGRARSSMTAAATFVAASAPPRRSSANAPLRAGWDWLVAVLAAERVAGTTVVEDLVGHARVLLARSSTSNRQASVFGIL